ncbi:hypothetical protein H4J59_12445 [Colwellia sp. MB02u-10]|jgi:hypothetical protein|uniref:hypothetical protein n=1 Tax=Colwellia sp. MB02u-10 TaxID=2759828 RepID=UPI0015F5FB01|nr:hypothetical protein [Colwellia sp. MB02u-10]MBA6341795.1 hypothetical protein [Colwellia sp. MB02u-10]
MNNMSLKKLSITVVVASLASNLAFANNDVTKTTLKVAEPTSSFSQLVTDYDVDKSNSLSANELAKNETLTKVFVQLDINGDTEINEEEFNQYLAKMKKHLL